MDTPTASSSSSPSTTVTSISPSIIALPQSDHCSDLSYVTLIDNNDSHGFNITTNNSTDTTTTTTNFKSEIFESLEPPHQQHRQHLLQNNHLQFIDDINIYSKINIDHHQLHQFNNINPTSSSLKSDNLIKSSEDLSVIKSGLFNKLISSQSQQMIVTTPINNNNSDSIINDTTNCFHDDGCIKNQSENLYRAYSLDAHSSKKNLSLSLNNTNNNIDSSTNSSTTNINTSNNINDCSNTTNNDSNNNNNNSSNSTVQQLSLDELEYTPVVFSNNRNRWYTNEEVAAILTDFSSHPQWLTNELQVRPKSGAVLLYSREKVRYRQDGYCWKKRKNGRTTREDHMKLKVQGIECIYGCYVHSALLPTFHRRCYWLLQNPDIVLVHYLNKPPDDQNKTMITFNPSTLEADTRRTWTNEEIIEEIGAVFGGISQIQHTLSISFPQNSVPFIQTTTSQHLQAFPNVHHQNQTPSSTSRTSASTSPDDLEQMIESSPNQSHIITTTPSASATIIDNNCTSNIDNNCNNQIDMTLTDNQQSSSTTTTSTPVSAMTTEHPDDDKNNNNVIISHEHLDEYEQQMTSLSGGQDDRNVSISSGNIDNGCLEPPNHLENTCNAQMTFDVVDEFNVVGGNAMSNVDQQQDDLAFVVDSYPTTAATTTSTTTATNNDNLVEETKNTTIGTSAHKYDSKQQPHQQHQIDQNLCSPVTQIYNKIVEDIETYALPLEPDQFNTNHHHHHHHHHDHHLQNQDNLTCSMDLIGCNIFNDERSSGQSASCQQNNHQDLLIGDYVGIQTNVDHHSSRVVNPIDDQCSMGNNVVESLSNVDDLRDLEEWSM